MPIKLKILQSLLFNYFIFGFVFSNLNMRTNPIICGGNYGGQSFFVPVSIVLSGVGLSMLLNELGYF